MRINEVKKEDEIYFQGAFWIIGNSVKDIIRGNFKLLCEKQLCNIEGKDIKLLKSKNSLSHKNLWKSEFSDEFNVPFDFYPRGRVSIYKGTAFIHINSVFNTPRIIDTVISDYGIEKLDIEIECNDILQGSHYDFMLE